MDIYNAIRWFLGGIKRALTTPFALFWWVHISSSYWCPFYFLSSGRRQMPPPVMYTFEPLWSPSLTLLLSEEFRVDTAQGMTTYTHDHTRNTTSFRCCFSSLIFNFGAVASQTILGVLYRQTGIIYTRMYRLGILLAGSNIKVRIISC